MDGKVFTNPEPLYNVQNGLQYLRETIQPLESKFRRILHDYDQQIEQYIASLSIPDRADGDYETRRRVLARKKANIYEVKAALNKYFQTKEEFLRVLRLFYNEGGTAVDSGLSALGKSITTLENYLNIHYPPAVSISGKVWEWNARNGEGGYQKQQSLNVFTGKDTNADSLSKAISFGRLFDYADSWARTNLQPNPQDIYEGAALIAYTGMAYESMNKRGRELLVSTTMPEEKGPVLRRKPDELVAILANTLVQHAEIVRDDLRDKGMKDGPEMEAYVRDQMKLWKAEIANDLGGNLQSISEISYEDRQIDNFIGSLDRLIARSEVQSDIIAYRGIDEEGLAALGLSSGIQISPGMNMYEDGFLSCSLVSDNCFTQSSPCIMRITIPKGTHAIYARDYSDFPDEYEIIAARGHSIYVQSVAQEDRNIVTGDPNAQGSVILMDCILTI